LDAAGGLAQYMPLETGQRVFRGPHAKCVAGSRFGIRTLRKSPGFAFFAIVTLGLGIGSVTSVFSVVNSVLLKPFAFHDPERLVVLRPAARERNEPPGPDNYKQYLIGSQYEDLDRCSDFSEPQLQRFHRHRSPEHPQGTGNFPNCFPCSAFSRYWADFSARRGSEGHDQEVILSWERVAEILSR
jgi:hypothetical protein